MTAENTLLDVVLDGTRAVVRVNGEVDLANSDELLATAGAAMASAQVEELLLDLGAVTFMDSTGLGALVQLRNLARAAGKRVSLRGITPPVAQVLTITRLHTLFGIADG